MTKSDDDKINEYKIKSLGAVEHNEYCILSNLKL